MTAPSWNFLRPEARDKLEQRDYSEPPLAERLRSRGVGAGDFVQIVEDNTARNDLLIPGMEIFPIKVFHQPHRGTFAELMRENEGIFAKIGLHPRQWSAATMYGGSVKGFHIHPAFVPEGRSAEEWFHYLYISGNAQPSERPYAREQWDVMYLLNGVAEFILVDERAGLPRRVIRIYMDGCSRPGPHNAGIIIPPGVGHAIRAESSDDLFMVYGTTTVFDPENEGRIASRIEEPLLPKDWEKYLGEKP
jgi:dTDP-4-dehydrorhamnose 3,5-epimerase-like enzyme